MTKFKYVESEIQVYRENMKNSCIKEDTAPKYASYSNSGAAKCTKTSVGANQYGQHWQQQRKNVHSARVEVPTDKSDKATLKTVDNLALNHSIKPCQFTVFSAVKRKLELGKSHPTTKKAYDPEKSKQVPEGTMDFIKPLKVPDLKISPKADFSSRESLLSNEELSKKIEAAQRDEMALKVNDRVPRKLEFSSSSSTSLFNYENIEPLKVPDFMISKKKDLSRDNSREKENRTKRVKKDDFQDLSKWPKSQKHISRKEIAESIVNRKLKNDRILAQGPKDNDAFSKLRPKPKSFTTSTVRKDDEKRYKLSNIPLTKSKTKTHDSRTSTSSSESLYPLDKGTRLHDKILIREGYKAMLSEITDRKHKDDSQLVNTLKQSDEQKYKSHSESRLSKHQSKSSPIKPIDTLTREQGKRISDKQKSIKADSKHSSEISEDLTTAVTSTASLSKSQNLTTETSSSSTLKSKEFKKSQSVSSRIIEDHQYSDDFMTSSDPISNNSMIETKISQENSLSEKLLDPLRISFRENSYSNQAEFVDLVTPDLNLTIRSSKRRKAPIGRENDSDEKDSKQSSLKTSQDNEQSQSGIQRQTSFADSFSESLQHAMETDRSRLPINDTKKHTPSLQNDNKDSDSKRTDITSTEINIDNKKMIQKPSVKVAEVQTQTVNDIATQTELFCEHDIDNLLTYSRIVSNCNEISGVSLDESRYEDEVNRIEDISIPNRMRTTSEISMYETTSSIKTETGTEISISTRDVTRSFNKYLDLEMARLIKDERQRYDKMEMLFKSREKTLNDRTKKLIKLEEEKRALRDTGQDSRISSVKKKQRALLLKLQQEKDEMNRLKELHKVASQERKLLLQKQRDMFNPEMSTKTILNKLKRSVDSQSPRRLSGPMKGYDIRSNSSISSLVDSDKSQLDRSQFDLKLNLSDISTEKNEQTCSRLEADTTLKQGLHFSDNIVDKKLSKIDTGKQQKDAAAVKLKYDLKARKFEEKMPKSDKMKQYDLDLVLRHNVNLSQDDDDKSISEHIKSESDAIIEEFAQVLKTQFPDIDSESLNVLEAPETIEAFKKMQRISPSSSKVDKETVKKLQHQYAMIEKNTKRKGVKSQKSKTFQSESMSKSEDSNCADDAFRHLNKRSKIDSEQLSDDNYQNSMLEELDFNESQSSLQALLKHSSLLKERNQQILRDINDERNIAAAENSESPLSQKDEEENVLLGNTSARSQLSLTISHQSSNDSDRSYSRSVVIRSQQDHHHHTTGLKNSKKLEQILKAREATLVSRRNCVEEWIAWHARLREEENRVARMEQAAYKLVSATTKALSHNDTTVSSDTSDVEGRIEQLSKKLYDRRVEMARLKKEARKQAKQRLRALEANLLNQIKKYDATIRDMRKKLDGKKLAVDTKSVIDFKVPELPIKKIQEIYKNSDLLRSKSDSEILSSRSPDKTKDDADKSDDADKGSSKSKSSGESSYVPTVYTINDELENELSEKSDASAVQSYKTKSNSEEIATQKSVITEREVQEMKRSSSQSSNISEEISSEAYSIKSQSEHVQTGKISETLSSQDVSEKIEHSASAVTSKKDSREGTNIEEDLTLESDETSSIFSRKLDHLQLHNKELNDDIHNLENDLKVLTDMMLNLSSKKLNNKSKSIDQSHQTSKDTDKSTSRDISEELLASKSNLQTNNIHEDLQARVEKILSDVVPETDDLVTSIEELDVRVKKVDILDDINKATTTEEISTHPASQTVEGDKLLDVQTDTIISEVIVTTIKEDVENASPGESQHLVYKSLKSTDDAISAQIDNTYRSDFNKFSNNHIQESNTDESKSKRSKEVSSDQIISIKMNNKDTAENEIYTATEDKSIENRISIIEEVSPSDIVSSKAKEEEATEDIAQTATEDKHKETKPSTIEEVSTDQISKVQEKENIYNEDACEDKISNPDDGLLETDDSMNKTAESDIDWVLSDSFDMQGFENKDSKTDDLQLEETTAPKNNKSEYQNRVSDIDDSAFFLPRGESTNLQDSFMLKIDESGEDIGIRTKEFNDILDIIEKTKIDEDPSAVPPAPAVLELESQLLSKADEKVESPVECDVSVTSKTADDASESIEEEIEGKNDGSGSDELASEKSLAGDCENLPQIKIGIEIQLVDGEDEKSKEELHARSPSKQDQVVTSGAKELGIEDRGSSDGEQLDNLVEVTESRNDTIEMPSPTEEKAVEAEEKNVSTEQSKKHVTVILNRTFDIIKDPEYEDISEESLEVSEIFDKSERAKRKSKKFSKIPEKYVIRSKSDEVLRILEDLSKKSSGNFKEQTQDASVGDKSDDLKTVSVECSLEKEVRVSPEKSPIENKPRAKTKSPVETLEHEAKGAEIAGDGEEAHPQQEVPKIANESSQSDGMDTPSGISEIEMDSPKGANENSRLDVDVLDDDLLSGNALLTQNQENEAKTEFHTRPMGVSSEKDIKAMIQKLQEKN